MKFYLIILFSAVVATGCDDDGTATTMSDQGQTVRGDVGVVDSGVQFIDSGAQRMDAGAGDGEVPDASNLANACIEPPAAPNQPPINLQARCRAQGGQLRIRDLRDPRCPDAPAFRDGDGDGFSDERVDVEIPNAIVTAVYGDDFAVQDPEGGAYSGLWVFTRNQRLNPDLRAGSRVSIRGSLMEFYTLTELQLDAEGGGLTITSQGPSPEPILVSDPTRIADGGDLTEAMESVLVEVQNATVRTTAPDCPRDFDMFVVTGGLRIEDEVELSYEASRGDFIQRAIGVLHFSFDHQKIIPRSDDDLDVVHCGGIPDKCEASECVAEVGAPEVGGIVITEIQDDPRGRDTDREYVELHNNTGAAVNLEGWWLQNCADVRVSLSGRIDPDEYRVWAGSQNRGDNGGVNADGLLGDLQLGNGQGSVLLYNNDGVLVDQVRYADEAPWPQRESGHSLVLSSSRADNSNGATWQESRREYGDGGWGTPGRR